MKKHWYSPCLGFHQHFLRDLSWFLPKNAQIDKTPIPIIIGANRACCMRVYNKADAPRAAVERMHPQYDSYRSAPIPATSPTLSLHIIGNGCRISGYLQGSCFHTTKSVPRRQPSYKCYYTGNNACVEAHPKKSMVW